MEIVPLNAACDDGDACTSNDVYDANCNCAGTFQDTDNDGICDADEACQTGNTCEEVILTIVLDNYPEETSWMLVDANGVTLYSGGTYGNLPDGSTFLDTFCLNTGCYDFTISDSRNDGICCGYGQGSYSLVADGVTLAAGGQFTTNETTNFCIQTSNPGGGDPCDDGDDCTTNDVYDGNCNCAGTFQDTDGDGICDADDDTNGNCTLNATCDDGDACTINDIYDANCNCAGTFQDTDGDGICDADDDTNGNCTLNAACDDGDACTVNDVYDANCNCVGTFQDSDNDGICDADETCNPGNTCTDVVLTIVFDNFPEETSWIIAGSNGDTLYAGGTYGNQADGSTLTENFCLDAGCYDFIMRDSLNDGICCQYGQGSYTLVGGGVTLASGGVFTTSDSTNFCIQASNGGEGDACDDGDACTINDVFDVNCNCAGTFQDTDGDGICDGEDDTNGNCTLNAPCNDGDACTTNDVYDANCNCAGTFQDTDSDGICDANDDTNGNCTLNAPCDDGSACTTNDMYDADCNCVGTFQDMDSDGICDAEDNTLGPCTLNNPCDDGDDCTINDIYDANCDCAGTFQDTDNDGICDANEVCNTGGTCTDVILTINLDLFPQETSWILADANGVAVQSGGTYGNLAGGSTLTDTFCLDEGCYDFTINDTQNDGICCVYGQGSYSLVADGINLASGGEFTTSETTNFCIEANNTGGGDPCDDGDPCTVNDVYDKNCDCAGTFQDTDNDGICDANEGLTNLLKVRLSGPYDANTGLMKDNLRDIGYIPLTEPYTTLGYTYVNGNGNATISPTVLDVTGEDAIIDWIFVELRDASDNSLVVESRCALLQADGDIVQEDGITPLAFAVAAGSLHYIVIKHRNHIAAITATTYAINQASVIDFTNVATPNTGLNMLQAGDATSDGAVNAGDRSMAWNERNTAGYLSSDVDLSGSTNAADRSITWNNRNISTEVP